jgi:hypothetical protein
MARIILYCNVSDLLEMVNPFQHFAEYVSDNDRLAALFPLERPGFVVAVLDADFRLFEQLGNDLLLFQTVEIDDISQLFIELRNCVAPEIVTAWGARAG